MVRVRADPAEVAGGLVTQGEVGNVGHAASSGGEGALRGGPPARQTVQAHRHTLRRRCTVAVVEWPGSSSARNTRPP